MQHFKYSMYCSMQKETDSVVPYKVHESYLQKETTSSWLLIVSRKTRKSNFDFMISTLERKAFQVRGLKLNLVVLESTRSNHYLLEFGSLYKGMMKF